MGEARKIPRVSPSKSKGSGQERAAARMWMKDRANAVFYKDTPSGAPSRQVLRRAARASQ